MKGKSFRFLVALSAVLSVVAVPLAAQSVAIDDLVCVPLQPHDDNKNHTLVTASATGASADDHVRFFFRRLNPDVEDFYYTVMLAAGDGSYWGVLPDPEDHALGETDPDWWRNHSAGDPDRSRVGSQIERDWLNAGSDADLAAWLADQKSEPVEYYAALYDSNGNRKAKSEMKIASVREDCRVTLDAQQLGESENQTIGETANWQNNQALFHWECDHLVSRINFSNVKEADSVCRACVVAVIPFWIPTTVAAAALAGVVLCIGEIEACEEPGSPSEP